MAENLRNVFPLPLFREEQNELCRNELCCLLNFQSLLDLDAVKNDLNVMVTTVLYHIELRLLFNKNFDKSKI